MLYLCVGFIVGSRVESMVGSRVRHDLVYVWCLFNLNNNIYAKLYSNSNVKKKCAPSRYIFAFFKKTKSLPIKLSIF